MNNLDPARRAERLLRAYPPAWRARYGDEMAALLTDEITERPHSWRRSANVLATAAVGRLRPGGPLSHMLDSEERARAGLARAAVAAGCFLIFSATVWAQMTIGWQWSAPDTTATFAGMILMTVAMYTLLACLVAAAAAVIWQLVRPLGKRTSLAAPAFLLVAGLVAVFIGGRHFANGWPGSVGHPWLGQGIVPGGLAAFSWASTLSITSYWAHPAALVRFPAPELAWMAVSPLALVATVTGAAKIVRRLELTPRVLLHLARVGRLAAGGMVMFICGACTWVVDGGSGPGGLFHSGAVDVVALGAMTLALVAARSSLRLNHPTSRRECEG